MVLGLVYLYIEHIKPILFIKESLKLVDNKQYFSYKKR